MRGRKNISYLKMDIKELTNNQLVLWLEEHNIQSYRAAQILKWIYLRQSDNFDVMTDINKNIKELLPLHFTIDRLKITRIKTSQDGSKKYLFQLKDGQYIESVLIPEKDHYTLCVSTQVGCAQRCRFCFTGSGGFARNLTKSEIVSQARDILNDLRDSNRLKNIVFMGMGEPLANYRNVINAIETITDGDCGLKISSRKVTISTAGLIPKLLKLGEDTTVNLAVSLNASNNKTRNFLMPINRKYPLEELIDACKKHPLRANRKITFEYILIKGINDSKQDAQRVAELLRHINAKINLIPFNEHENSDFKQPEESAISKFQEILRQNNYTVMIRRSKGRDISAACGQLRGQTALN